MIPMPSKSGLTFIAMMALLYLSSMQSQSGLVFFVIGLLLGCLVLNMFYARHNLGKFVIDFPASIRMVEGETSGEGIRLVNLSSRSQGMIELRSRYGRIFEVGMLRGGEDTHVFPGITFPVRGVFLVSGFVVNSSFPFGLVNAKKRLECHGEFIVLPKVYPCNPPPAGGFEPMLGGTFAGIHKSPAGSSFAGIRPFTTSDSLKHIHWKSSAKGLGLMVKEFSEELSGRVAIVVDQHDGEPDKAGETSLDMAVRACGSLALSALDAGHHVDIIQLDSGEVSHFPPFCDGSALLELLARVPGSIRKPPLDADKIADVADTAPSRASICLILASGDPVQFSGAAQRLVDRGRTVSMYLPEAMEGKFEPPGHAFVRFYSREAIR